MKRGEIARLARAAKRVPFSHPGNADYTALECWHHGCKNVTLYPASRMPGVTSVSCHEHQQHAFPVEVVRVPGVEVLV